MNDNDQIKIEAQGDRFGEFETLGYIEFGRFQDVKTFRILRAYRIAGKIGKILILPFMWPYFLFEKITGPRWFTKQYDTEFAGALVLQVLWLLLLLFGLVVLTVPK